MFPSAQFTEKHSVLSAEFNRRLADFEAQKCRFELLSNLFAVDVESAPTNLHLELIELQCCDIRQSLTLWVLHSFHVSSPTQYPQVRTQAAQMHSMFGSTYLCEQLFSLMKMNFNITQESSH